MYEENRVFIVVILKVFVRTITGKPLECLSSGKTEVDHASQQTGIHGLRLAWSNIDYSGNNEKDQIFTKSFSFNKDDA